VKAQAGTIKNLKARIKGLESKSTVSRLQKEVQQLKDLLEKANSGNKKRKISSTIDTGK
jgi:hypothetical protein